MNSLRLAFALLLLAITATSASALVIDDFESGDLAAWNIEAPYYTSVSIVTPGAGASNKALAVQEIAGAAHSVNALAHRNFTTPQNWSSYATLEFDASISAGDWNGYSILLYNNSRRVLLRGIHSDAGTSGFRRIMFDMSGIARDQITEIVVYVNRTRQDAGQVLYLDNIQITNNAVPASPNEVLIADLDTTGTDINRWTNYDANTSPQGKSATYQTATQIIADGGSNVAKVSLSGTSASAYAQYALPKTLDLTDYVTLQFDVKLATGTSTNGYSVRGYNQGNINNSLRYYQGAAGKTRKFTPLSGGYATCQVDISGMDRDQFSSIMIYVNRTSQGSGQVIYIDNIKVTKTPVAPSPDQIWLDTFDAADGFPADLTRWDNFYNITGTLLDTDFVSAPYALNLKLNSSASTSPYARRSWAVSGITNYDLGDYRSLMFEAKTVQNGATPLTTTPLGFTLNPVNGVTGTSAAGIESGDYQLPFHPISYNSDWTTYAVDITDLDLDQLKWLRIYMNRCGTNGGNTDTTGQILRIDNIRASKEPAPPVDYGNVDDFEDGDINDWFYESTHEYPDGSGTSYPGVTHALTTDAASGRYAIKITNNVIPGVFPGSSSAYCRKTMHARWLDYPTLVFDAKVANSTTSAGFSVVLRNLGGYGPAHAFYPTNEWKTFRIDITGDRYATGTTTKVYHDIRQEIIGLLFYVNGLGSFGTAQNGSQELYIDNIRLSTTPVKTSFTDIGELRSVEDGSTVSLSGEICTGFFENAMMDRNNWSLTRNLMFIEEADRSAAIPVVLGYDGAPIVTPGSKVAVTGTLVTDMGIRYIYASSVTEQETGSDIPSPIGILNKACGSGPRGLDAGVSGFTGQSTNGMLVTIWGKVTAVGGPDAAFRSWRYIDDGSGVEGDNGAVGVRVYDFSGAASDPSEVGRYAQATGFVLNEPERDSSGILTGKVVRGLWLSRDLAEPFRLIGP